MKVMKMYNCMKHGASYVNKLVKQLCGNFSEFSLKENVWTRQVWIACCGTRGKTSGRFGFFCDSVITYFRD